MKNINRLCVSAYVKGQAAIKAAGQKVRDRARQVVEDESGMEIIAIILILAIVIALIVIFRKQLADIINKIFGKVAGDTNAALTGDETSAPDTVTPVTFK